MWRKRGSPCLSPMRSRASCTTPTRRHIAERGNSMLPRRSLLTGAGALFMSIAPRVSAQEASWPSRTIKLIVGFAPGGTADILARKLAASLSARLGQTMIVENRAGASGMTAPLDVARAPADGYERELVGSTDASLDDI